MVSCNVTGNLVTLEASGTLTVDDYKKVLPVINELIKDGKKPAFFISLEDFHGWEPSAIWEELKFDVKHRNDFGPMVVVGESDIQKWLTRFSSMIFPSEVKYFDKKEEKEAREWIESKVS